MNRFELLARASFLQRQSFAKGLVGLANLFAAIIAVLEGEVHDVSDA